MLALKAATSPAAVPTSTRFWFTWWKRQQRAGLPACIARSCTFGGNGSQGLGISPQLACHGTTCQARACADR